MVALVHPRRSCLAAVEAGSSARNEIAKPLTSLQRFADTCVEHGLELARLYECLLVNLLELIVIFAAADKMS